MRGIAIFRKPFSDTAARHIYIIPPEPLTYLIIRFRRTRTFTKPTPTVRAPPSALPVVPPVHVEQLCVEGVQ